ncbi:amino acid transporter [Whalleya microplaca]|nr:amino acid transporter [Whalleya microplaca]
MGFSKLWPRQATREVQVVDEHNASSSDISVIRDGELAYTVAKAGNGSRPAYQEAAGAPVESNSPLGYHVGWITVIFLNVNQMIGTGIFSTPATVLNRTGSVGLALIYWAIGVLMAFAGFCVYLELASYFPNRSGSEVVYLEQAFPRPKHFFPVTFALFTVVLSFSSSNAVVLSQYVWQIAGKTPTDWQLKGVAVAANTLATICVIVHNKYSLWATNVIGVIKILTLIFISITGLVVLGGNVSRISDPGANFRNSFEGTTTNGNDLSVVLVNIIFSYAGYNNAFNMVNEIKNPIKTLKRNGAISVLIVAVLYMLCNIAYFAAVPKEQFAKSKQIAAGVFFVAVFGKGGAEVALNVLVLLSAFGNLLAVLIGQSRLIREVGRQGVLPFTGFWVSTKPFGTPFGPYFLKWLTTFIMIVAPPAGDAFQFVISLRAYPDGIFQLAMALGVYVIRYRHKRLGRGAPDFKTWDVALIFYILIQVYVIATPWIPPKGGPYAGEVSFWYATYCVVGIGIIVACALYYVAWMYLLPRWGGYRIRPEISSVDDEGANTHRLVKVPLDNIAKWDDEHDEAGRLRRRLAARSPRSSQEDGSHGQEEPKVL